MTANKPISEADRNWLNNAGKHFGQQKEDDMTTTTEAKHTPEWTPEPWDYRERTIGTEQEPTGLWNVTFDNGDNIAEYVEEENARRIVACVNAAAGISTEFLESGANLDRLAKLLEQRDELAAALRNADCGCTLRERDSGHRVGCWKPDADAALAKVAA